MVLATRQAFAALRAAGNTEIPTNLRSLYRLANMFVVAYWRRVLEESGGSPRTPAPPLRRCALSPNNCRLRCAVADARRPTSTGYWPPQFETPQRIRGDE